MHSREPATDRVRTVQHLIRQVLNRNDETPNYMLLLGAGTSKSAGIDTGVDLTRKWRTELARQHAGAEPAKQREWLADQHWYESEEEYSTLFELLYDEASQRRACVEELVKQAHPTWGHAYLVGLLEHRYFDVVLTTNFDDLLEQACHLYAADLRPMVCAHDSTVSGIRLMSRRPKVVKLHGDFLYDSIKNTRRETESLERNTRDKIGQFAREYGLVVVGYGGGDRSVMDTLDMLLRSEENFPHGVYWCYRDPLQPSRRLLDLMRRDRVYLVRISGFDELLAEMHDRSGVDPPTALIDPMAVAKRRAQIVIERSASSQHHIIERDRRRLVHALSSFEGRSGMPDELVAIVLAGRGEHRKAVGVLQQLVEKSPESSPLAWQYANALFQCGDLEQLREFVPSSAIDIANRAFWLLRAEDPEAALRLADDAVGSGSGEDDPFLMINRAIALKQLGRDESLGEQLDAFRAANALDHPRFGLAFAAGVAALEERDDLVPLAREAVENGQLTADGLRDFPVFAWAREDCAAFADLIAEVAGKEDDAEGPGSPDG